MSSSDIIAIIGILITMAFGIPALFIKPNKGNVYDTSVKGNNNRINNSNTSVNKKTNSYDLESHNNKGEIINNSKISGSIYIDKSKKETHINYYNQRENDAQNDDGLFWMILIVGIISIGLAITYYTKYKEIILTILQWPSLIGFICAFVWASKVIKHQSYMENKILNPYTLFSLPMLFLGTYACIMFQKYSFCTPPLLDEFIEKFKKEGIFSYLFDAKYKIESMYLIFQILSTIFIGIFIFLLIGALLYTLSKWKINTSEQESKWIKIWKKVDSLKVISFDKKISVIYTVILFVVIFPTSSGIWTVLFK